MRFFYLPTLHNVVLSEAKNLHDYFRDPSLRSGRHALKRAKLRKVSYLLFLASLLSACVLTPTPLATNTISAPHAITAEENLYAPEPADDQLNRAEVILTSINLIERTDLNPARVEIDFLGSMPSVCNELRVEVKAPDNEYQIHIEAYSVKDPNIKCENVFQQFETNILLGVYSPGRYAIWVNNKYIGDFVSL